MPVNKDDLVFGNTTFSDILKEIHKNQKHKKNQINILINELKVYVKDLKDAALVVPLLKDYLDLSIKNDDQLIKMAQVYQRYIAAANRIYDDPDGGGILTDTEKQQLIDQAKDSAKDDMMKEKIVESDQEFTEQFEELFKKTDDVLKSREVDNV